MLHEPTLKRLFKNDKFLVIYIILTNCFNIIILYNHMPTFCYKCVLLITHNLDNISKTQHRVFGVSSLRSAYPIHISDGHEESVQLDKARFSRQVLCV